MSLIRLLHMLVYLVPIILMVLGPWVHSKTGAFSRFSKPREILIRTVRYLVIASGSAAISTSLFISFGHPLLAILMFAFAAFTWYQYFAPIWHDFEAKVVNP